MQKKKEWESIIILRFIQKIVKTRNSITLACNSVTDQNLFTIKERYVYHE